MLQFLAALLNKNHIKKDLQNSIGNVAISTGVDRRRTIRVRYPAVGAVGHLPEISYKGEVLEVQDVSVGGACLVDSNNSFGEVVGRDLELKLSWGEEAIVQASRIVGVNFDRRHIQFLDPKPALMVRLNYLLRPGYLGAKFYRVDLRGENPKSISADEFWLSPLGESLGFYSRGKGDVKVEMLAFKESHLFLESGRVVCGDKGPKIGEEVEASRLMDIAVCLANFKNPTNRIDQLLNNIQVMLTGQEDRSIPAKNPAEEL